MSYYSPKTQRNPYNKVLMAAAIKTYLSFGQKGLSGLFPHVSLYLFYFLKYGIIE